MGMQTAQIRSAKGTHFTGAIVQNAFEEEHIPTNLGSSAKRMAIMQVSIQSDQQLSYELWCYGKDSCANADLDLDTTICMIPLDLTANGFQFGGAGQWYYTYTLAVPVIIWDDDSPTTPPELHVRLVNKSAAAKDAGAAGEVVLQVTVQLGA